MNHDHQFDDYLLFKNVMFKKLFHQNLLTVKNIFTTSDQNYKCAHFYNIYFLHTTLCEIYIVVAALEVVPIKQDYYS